jgi:hypothetical protein
MSLAWVPFQTVRPGSSPAFRAVVAGAIARMWPKDAQTGTGRRAPGTFGRLPH